MGEVREVPVFLNWLGQELRPGIVVYNGQRRGNYSVFRVGRIIRLTQKTEVRGGQRINTIAQVDWLNEKGYGRVKKSSLDANSLVKIELDKYPHE